MTVLDAILMYLLIGVPIVIGSLWSGSLIRRGGERIPQHHILVFFLAWPVLVLFMIWKASRLD